jgi:ABC-type multidrug transport system fused ATPase/permease subunit
MKTKEFSRIPGWNSSRRMRRRGILISLGAALSLPLPLLIVGQIVQLLVVRHAGAPAPEGWLPWLNRQWQSLSPGLAHPDTAILVFVVAAMVLFVAEALLLRLLERSARQVARHVGDQIRSALHDQAYRLGASELLGVSRSRPEMLFTEKANVFLRWLQREQQVRLWSLLVLGLLVGLSLLVNFWLTLLVLLLVVMVGRFQQALRFQANQAQEYWNERAQEYEGRLVQSLRLAPLTAGYAPHGLPGETFAVDLAEYQTAVERSAWAGWSVGWWTRLAVLLCGGFILFIIGLSAEVTLSGVVLSTACLVSAWGPLQALRSLRELRPDAMHAASDIVTYLDRGPAVVQLEQPQRLERLHRQLRLDRVTLADRAGKRLLDEVSCTIPAGQHVALIASEPATPIALAGLFVRFYDPASGRILFDDVDIRRAALDTVRGQAMLVAQDSYLFPGSLLENLTCGETGFTSLQIQDVLSRAQAATLVEKQAAGLATRVGQRDMQLAPHDAFRFALARALLRHPSLLIVEEPDVECDETTGELLDLAIQSAREACTLITLPARLATLRAAQHVFLFHQGKLYAEGPHAELLQTNELYQHLIYMRFNLLRRHPETVPKLR